LTHFIFEDEQHRAACPELVRLGGTLEAFEKLIGPVDEVQREWYAHVGRIKAKLSGANFQRRTLKQRPAKSGTIGAGAAERN
jgi:hypothetical protein